MTAPTTTGAVRTAAELGPLWIKQLIHTVTKTRNSAAENLLLIKPDGDYAAHHRALIAVADRMLAAAAPDAPALALLAGIQALCISADQEWCRQGGALSEFDKGWLTGQLHIFDMYTSVDKSAISQAREYIEKLAAPALAQPIAAPLSDDQRDVVRDALSVALGEAMDCTRVWSAWGYGTMGEGDFQLVADNDERLEELVDAVALAIAPGTESATDTQADRIAALEAKCALYAASLKQADAVRDQMVAALKNAHPYVDHAGTRIEIGAALAAAGKA